MSKILRNVIMEASIQTRVDSAIRWLEMGMPAECIARGEDLSLETVREIEKFKTELGTAKCGYARCSQFACCEACKKFFDNFSNTHCVN